MCAEFVNTTALGCSWQKPSLLVQLRGCSASANAPQPCTGSQNGMGRARWIWGATVLNKICLPGVRCPWLGPDHPCGVLLLLSHPLLGYCVVVISAGENLISAGKGKSENNGKAFGIWHFSVEDGNKYIYNFTVKEQDFFSSSYRKTIVKAGKALKDHGIKVMAHYFKYKMNPSPSRNQLWAFILWEVFRTDNAYTGY